MNIVKIMHVHVMCTFKAVLIKIIITLFTEIGEKILEVTRKLKKYQTAKEVLSRNISNYTTETQLKKN